MKTAMKVFVILGTIIGYLWWIGACVLGVAQVTESISFKLPESFIGEPSANLTVQLISMILCTVFGFVAAAKGVRNAGTIIMSILLLICAGGLYVSQSYLAGLMFSIAGIIGFIRGCIPMRSVPKAGGAAPTPNT